VTLATLPFRKKFLRGRDDGITAVFDIVYSDSRVVDSCISKHDVSFFTIDL